MGVRDKMGRALLNRPSKTKKPDDGKIHRCERCGIFKPLENNGQVVVHNKMYYICFDCFNDVRNRAYEVIEKAFYLHLWNTYLVPAREMIRNAASLLEFPDPNKTRLNESIDLFQDVYAKSNVENQWFNKLDLSLPIYNGKMSVDEVAEKIWKMILD